MILDMNTHNLIRSRKFKMEAFLEQLIWERVGMIVISVQPQGTEGLYILAPLKTRSVFLRDTSLKCLSKKPLPSEAMTKLLIVRKC